MSDKIRIAGIIAITVIVFTALICTTVITMGIGTAAAIDTAFVLSGIAGIAGLASGMAKKEGENE